MNIDTTELKALFPNEVINGKKIEKIIVNPIDKRIGVVALSGKIKNIHLLRLYQFCPYS